MATKQKVENYTVAQVATLLETYTPEATELERKAQVDALAEKFGKSARSIVAKLVREKVYVGKSYTTKTGEKPVKKDETADAIGAVLRMTEAEIESLTKANKTALAKIFAALANSKPLASGETPTVMENE
jgi:hypothetical protein